MRKMTEEDYKRLGKQAGFEWMGPQLPEDMLQRTEWRCLRAGHKFLMRGANVYLAVTQGGRGCPYCSRRWRRTGADYHALAKRHGVEWVGERLPPNTRTPTEWRLPDGDIIEQAYRAIDVRATQLGNHQLRVDGR
jgi:hypothetical protein